MIRTAAELPASEGFDFIVVGAGRSVSLWAHGDGATLDAASRGRLIVVKDGGQLRLENISLMNGVTTNAEPANGGGPHAPIGAPIYFLDAELKPVSLSTACGIAEGSGLGLSREWAEKLSQCDLDKRQVRR